MRNSSYRLIILSLAVFLFYACGGKKETSTTGTSSGHPPPPKVDVFIVHTTTISNNIEVPGTLVADESAELHPELSGRIVALSVREGMYVSKGTVLARLYDADLQAQKRKLELQLKNNLAIASRYQQLKQIGGISQQDYDIATLQTGTTRADIDVINTQIERTVIRAPFAGKIGLRNVSVGAYVTPQSVLATISKTSDLRIDFSVPEQYVPQLKPGLLIHFKTGSSDQLYGARVIATESGIAQNTRSLGIRARVEGDASGLVPGGFVTVSISFDPDNSALLIPTQAIIPTARGKKVAIYHSGNVSMTEITTGIRDSSDIQVVAGLQEGDTVITTGLMSVKDKGKVSIGHIVNQGGQGQ